MTEKEHSEVREAEILIDETIVCKTATRVRDGMQPIHFFAYNVGHYFNDLCSSLWFIYLTFYLEKVVGLSPSLAASA